MAAHDFAEPLLIADVAELRAFAATRAFVSARPVVLEVPGMSSSHAFAAAERLNRDRAECGCSFGAGAMWAGFALATSFLMLQYGAFTLALLERLPIAAAAAIAFAGLGKLAGITHARRR